MKRKIGKYVITGGMICFIIGVIMALAGVYWMWIAPESADSKTTACCCFGAAAALLLNRSRKKS